MKTVPLIYNFISGAIGKKIVVKHYSNGIVVTLFPDMTNIKPSPHQYRCRKTFKEAVAFARVINNDPVQKKLWKQKFRKGSVYNNAIRYYMKYPPPPSDILHHNNGARLPLPPGLKISS